jgi:DNA-directed RNA polymerase subunit M/transcription elongation factor TFIIS
MNNQFSSKFCKKCSNYLKLIEEDDNLYYKCYKCNDDNMILINDICIFNKQYKNNELKSIEFDNINKNKYHIEDNSLPKNKSKCSHCKKINNNPYFVKYINMIFNIIYICINCNKNYTH